MPWPISAGVFGIARTTRSLPVAATIASLRTPAMTLTCKAPATLPSQGLAAASNACGFTAQTTTSATSIAGPASERAVAAVAADEAAPGGSLGSTTTIERPGRPALTRPPTSACAMLPPPMKTMLRTAQCKHAGGSQL